MLISAVRLLKPGLSSNKCSLVQRSEVQGCFFCRPCDLAMPQYPQIVLCSCLLESEITNSRWDSDLC